MKNEPSSPPRGSSAATAMTRYQNAVSSSILVPRASSAQAPPAPLTRVKTEPLERASATPPPPPRPSLAPSTRAETPSQRRRQSSTPGGRATPSVSRVAGLGARTSVTPRARSSLSSVVRANSRARSTSTIAPSRSSSRVGGTSTRAPSRSVTSAGSLGYPIIIDDDEQLGQQSPLPLTRRVTLASPALSDTPSNMSTCLSYLEQTMEPDTARMLAARAPRTPRWEEGVARDVMQHPPTPVPSPIPDQMRRATDEILEVIRQLALAHQNNGDIEFRNIFAHLMEASLGDGDEEAARSEMMKKLRVELDVDNAVTTANLGKFFALLDSGCYEVIDYRIDYPLSKSKAFHQRDAKFMSDLKSYCRVQARSLMAQVEGHEARWWVRSLRTVWTEGRADQYEALKARYSGINKQVVTRWHDALANLSTAIIAETWPAE